MDDKNGTLARAAQRPPMRSEDPRRDAAERAKQILENIGEFGGNVDEFYVPEGILPEGYVGEWREYSVYGMVDPSKQIELARAGWEPVPVSYWPAGMPAGSTEKNLLRKGMQYMMRPKEVSDEMRRRERQSANDQMRSKKEQVEGAARGPFEATNKGAPLSRVKTGYVPMAIPD